LRDDTNNPQDNSVSNETIANLQAENQDLSAELEAVKAELAKTKETLQTELQEVQDKLEKICAGEDCNFNNNTVENAGETLRNVPPYASALYQNIPNPTPTQRVTKIPFFIIKNAKTASIVISDLNGRSLENIKVAQREFGHLDNMNAGVYPYTLYVNGKVIDTKQMVILK